MNVLRAERVKLASTRAPWICSAIAVAASLGFAVVFIVLGGDQIPVTVGTTQTASSFGRTVVLVMAVLAAATEFNWGTIRTTFQAVPRRVPALLAKATVVGAWSAVLGLVIGFGSWGLGLLLEPGAELALRTAADWRMVAGQGPIFLLTGVLGVGVGLLLRSTGLALGVTLVWTQLVEGLVFLVPRVGPDIYQWMPFFAASQFVGGGITASALALGEPPLSPAGYGAYFAAIAFALLAAGTLVATRRDA